MKLKPIETDDESHAHAWHDQARARPKVQVLVKQFNEPIYEWNCWHGFHPVDMLPGDSLTVQMNSYSFMFRASEAVRATAIHPHEDGSCDWHLIALTGEDYAHYVYSAAAPDDKH